MAVCGIEYWQKRTSLAYKQMLKRHTFLWEYVKRFIIDSEIESVLEVGCGLESPVKNWVNIHTGIDLNDKTDALHKDFTLMEPCEVMEHDLLLACGVIEHCDGYRNFLKQVKRFSFKHTLISFFCSLDRDDDIHNLHPDGYIINKYSWWKIISVLEEFELRHFFVNLTPRDDVLIIMQEGKDGS